MKLVVTFGLFNPPTICDANLVQKLADYVHHDSDVVVLTNDRFNKNHPMGILERQEVMGCMLPRDVQLRMDYDDVRSFLSNVSSKYESVVYISSKELHPFSLKSIASFSTVPVKFVTLDVGDTEEAADQLYSALVNEDFELFSKYYGGDTNTMVEHFNKLKDRVKCLN